MTLADILNKANELLIAELRKEAKEQGHYLTGGLEASFSGKVITGGNSSSLQGTALSYSQILNDGVAPNRIPFQRGSGAGHSRYIEALIGYWKLRGLDDKEAVRAAFATAIKQKEEGMSTTASDRFSSTGTRFHFIGQVKQAVDTRLDDIILGGIDQMVDEAFHKTPSEIIR